MPRVKKSDQPLKVNASTRLDPALKAAVDRLAKSEGRTVSQWLERLIAANVAPSKSS